MTESMKIGGPTPGDGRPHERRVDFQKVVDFASNKALADKLAYVQHVARTSQSEELKRTRRAKGKGSSKAKEQSEYQKKLEELLLFFTNSKAKDDPQLKKLFALMVMGDVDADPLIDKVVGRASELSQQGILSPQEHTKFLKHHKKMLEGLIDTNKAAQKANEEALEEIMEVLDALKSGQNAVSVAEKDPSKLEEALKTLKEIGGSLSAEGQKTVNLFLQTKGKSPGSADALKTTLTSEEVEMMAARSFLLEDNERLAGSSEKHAKRIRGSSGERAAASGTNPYAAEDAVLMKYLKELLPILEKYAGSDPQVMALATQFARISKDYPNLTKQDITDLQNMAQEVNDLSGKIPPKERITFYEELQKMLHDMQQANLGIAGQYSKEIKKLEGQIKNEEAVARDIEIIMQLLHTLEKHGSLSQSGMEQLAAALGDLLKRESLLGPKLQKEVNTVLGDLGHIHMKGNFTFAEYVADIQMATWVSSYLKNHPHATMQQLIAYLDTQIKKYSSSSKGAPFAQNFFQELEYDVARMQNGQGGSTGVHFIDESKGNIIVNPNLWQSFTQLGNPISGGIDTVESELEAVYNAVNGSRIAAQQQVTTLNDRIGELTGTNGALNSELAQVRVETYATQQVANPFTAQFKAMLDHLKEILALLAKYAPGDPAVLADIAQLAKIAKDYPNLTASDIKELQNLVSSIPALASKLQQEGKISTQDYISILNGIEAMLKAMEAANKGQIGKYQKLIQQLELTIQAAKDLQIIQKLLTMLKDGKQLTPAQYETLITALSNLGQISSKLPKDQQAEVQKLMQAMMGGDGKHYTLEQYLADVQTYIWIKEYMSKHPNATEQEIAKYLAKKEAAYWGKYNASSSFSKQLYEALEGDLAKFKADQPGYTGVRFGNNDSEFGNYQIDPIFWSQMNHDKKYAGIGNLGGIVSAATSAEDYMNAAAQEAENEITEAKQAIGALQAADTQIEAAITSVNNKILAADSLANDFANTVLGKFMPQQEAYLMQLAMMFSIMNFGAAAGNMFLRTISGWGTSGNDFSLGRWLAANPNATKSQIQNHINQAKQNVKNYLSQIEALLKELKGKLSAVNGKISAAQAKLKSGKLSPSQTKNVKAQLAQWQKMQKQLTTDIGNSTQTEGDLTNYQKYLDDPGGSGIDSSKVEQYDNTIVNGNTDPKNPEYKGGLANIYHDINNDQASWSSQGQTEQVQLEMEMTKVQQEWTVVSTALQILFQSYKVFAGAIYK